MAGVKGRSGGARPGAGRKPKAKTPAAPASGAVDLGQVTDPLGLPKTDDGLVMLKAIVGNPLVPVKERLRASIALAQYQHMKKGDGGLKDERAEKAKKAAGAKFGAAPPPLALVKR